VWAGDEQISSTNEERCYSAPTLSSDRTVDLGPDFAFEVDFYVRVVAVGLDLRCSTSAESELAVMGVGFSVFVEEIELAGDFE
jgi:hypothetical protein